MLYIEKDYFKSDSMQRCLQMQFLIYVKVVFDQCPFLRIKKQSV